MEKFQAVLLNVWREACRHIEIQQSAEAITRLLHKQIPLTQLFVRRIDEQRSCLTTVAWGLGDRPGQETDTHTECSPQQLRKLLAWCRHGEVGRGANRKGQRTAWQIAVPDGIYANVLAVPIGNQPGPLGVLLFVPPAERTLTTRQVALAGALREPFSAALANDHQVGELAALREAAEAQKESLLARMGRTSIADTIVGEDSGLRAVIERVDRVAPSDLPVLIFGETGSGKELVARAIHQRSPRSAGPIIRVNCGAIPPELIDSELFGHERGAFTGALETRRGWFERADTGTLFLDEIGDMPPAAQVRLLRVLQDGWLERVGGKNPIHVDVRVVAATHRDLARMVTEGDFREDLWYRLSVFPIALPPLRERTADVPPLARHFAERAAVHFGLPVVHPTPEDIRLLATYTWPGNVRELAAVIDRAAILGNGERLEVAQALGNAAIQPSLGKSEHPQRTKAETASPVLSLDDAIRAHIEAALAATQGRIEGKHGVAAMLKINPHTLRARMRKLGIDWQRFR